MFFFYRILCLAVTAIAVGLLPFVALSVLVALFGPFIGYLVLPLGVVGLSLLCFCPWLCLLLFLWVRSSVRAECRHIASVGRGRALWSVSAITNGALLVDNLVVQRQSLTTDSVPAVFEEGSWEQASEFYSDTVLLVGRWLDAPLAEPFALLVSLFTWFYLFCKLALRVGWYALLTLFGILVAVSLSPAEMVTKALWASARVVYYCTPLGWPSLRLRVEWLRLYVLLVVTDLAALAVAVNVDFERHYSETLAGRRRKVGAVFRQKVMQAVRFISAVRLPAFVRNRFKKVSGLPELARGREILAELGWPVNVEIVEREANHGLEGHSEWARWKVADTSFATGIRQTKLAIRENLQDIMHMAPSYYRTEEYKTTRNELEATARYFHERPVDFNVDILDDVWDVVRPIFSASRLTRFGDIIYLWEKKYALGFWMTDERGRRKLSRRSFIARVGYPAFKSLWARTFVRASEILPVAHMSVKDEALPARKYIADKVRTITGSPISHYIGSTVFNFWSNHNFQYESTPIKIGMPLNGHWMGRVFDQHARFATHAEGDFEAFDSMVEGPVKSLIRAVRKRGFTAHQDYKAIADLIDVMYDQIDHQFLGHTSTGTVFMKGSGLTTGHSSTSMDNSVACVIFYIAAWKKLTGLTGREFLHFNELSCYGDDHMLSTQAGCPSSWNVPNIKKVMASWGVKNNLFNKKLRDMTFLGKHNSAVTPTLAAEFRAAGLSGITRAVWHDKDRLIGKLTAKITRTEPTYRATRLFSYLTLTAHHPEVYQAIVKLLQEEPLRKIVKNNFGSIPTYNQVLVKWYSATKTTEIPNDIDPEEAWANDGRLITVGTPGLYDHVLQALSAVPDLLNPALFNYGPTRALTRVLSPHLQWVPSLIQKANGVAALADLDYHLRRTPYAFIDTDIVTPLRVTPNWGTLLLRHWLFLAYKGLKPSFRAVTIGKWALRKSADLAFLVRGQVIADLPRDAFPFDEVLVCAILDWFWLSPDILFWFDYWVFPDFAAYFDVLWNRVLSFIWTSVPANFGEVDPLVKQLGRSKPVLLVEAGTGTGKSTSLVAHLVLSQSCAHRKLIVVEPTTLLCVGLRDYVGSAFGLHCTAATAGEVFDPAARVWFMTPQSLLGRLAEVRHQDLLFFDECHLESPISVLVRELFKTWGFRSVWASATPSIANKEQADLFVSVPIAKLWSVHMENRAIATAGHYIEEAISLANGFPPRTRVAVIVDTPEQAERCLERSVRGGQVLSSRHSPALLDVDRFFATSVLDVGVTIPDLDVIIHPNWEYAGRGVRYRIQESTAAQRRGRVGRTRNGTVFVLSAPDDEFGHRPPSSRSSGWQEAVSSGLPVSLGWTVDPTAMEELFGTGELDAAQRREFERVTHIFLSNFRALKALELTRSDVEAPTGRAATLVPTGSIGHFSGSAPQDLVQAGFDAFDMCKRLVLAIKSDDPVFNLMSEPLARIRTGPVYRVANLIQGLANDPSGFVPSLLASGSGISDVDFDSEIQEIKKMLTDLAATDAA